MFKWLRRRREARRLAAEDANRLTRPSEWGEPLCDPDPIEELARIVGDSDVSDPRAHGKDAQRNSRRRAKPAGTMINIRRRT